MSDYEIIQAMLQRAGIQACEVRHETDHDLIVIRDREYIGFRAGLSFHKSGQLHEIIAWEE